MAGVPRIKLGSQGLEVSAQGLGCMGMSTSAFYGAPKPDSDMINLVHHAISAGVTFIDTSDIYGANEILLGKALKGEIREKVEVATKLGIKYDEVCGDPAYVRSACEASLQRLQVDRIDLYYLHRSDTRLHIEIAMGELKKLVKEGKIKYIGLSEASTASIKPSASTIRRAHAVHPLTVVQLEWSLWSRDVEEEVIPTCRELGIGIVAYSPLGQGFRKYLPRFQPLAAKKGCTPLQLALAWVHHQGNDVVPIPGTTKIQNLEQNIGALSVNLTPQEMNELESIASADSVKGVRYGDGLSVGSNNYLNYNYN